MAEAPAEHIKRKSLYQMNSLDKGDAAVNLYTVRDIRAARIRISIISSKCHNKPLHTAIAFFLLYHEKSDQIPPNVMLFLKTNHFLAGYKVKLSRSIERSLAAQSMCHLLLVILWFFLLSTYVGIPAYSGSCSLNGGSPLDTLLIPFDNIDSVCRKWLSVEQFYS